MTLRVLHSISMIEGEFGGPITILETLLPELKRLGVHSEVVTTTARQPTCEQRREYSAAMGAEVHQFARGTSFGWRYAPGFRRWVNANIHRFDIVHTRALYNFPTLVTGRAAKRAGIPRILEPQGSATHWGQSYRRYKKLPYTALIEGRNGLRSEGFLVTHARESSELQSMLRPPHGRVFQVTPPVLSMPAQRDTRGENLLYLGRLHPKKGIELLLAAYARVADRLGPLRIAGSGEAAYAARLQAVADDLGIGHRVAFAGHVTGDAKQQEFVQARLFVLPSWDENFGLAAVEAAGNGVPVLASRAVDAATELEERRLARLFATGDERALSALLVAAWDDSAWQREVAAQGSMLVKRDYSPAAYAGQILECYRALCDVR